ncbi:hypothetical protein E2320_008659, partial [Naja naja]
MCALHTRVYAQEGGEELMNFSSSHHSTKAATAACPFKIEHIHMVLGGSSARRWHMGESLQHHEM